MGGTDGCQPGELVVVDGCAVLPHRVVPSGSPSLFRRILHRDRARDRLQDLGPGVVVLGR